MHPIMEGFMLRQKFKKMMAENPRPEYSHNKSEMNDTILKSGKVIFHFYTEEYDKLTSKEKFEVRDAIKELFDELRLKQVEQEWDHD